MNNRTAYLAGPIDRDPNLGRSPLKDEIVRHLNDSNIAVFRPEMAWNVGTVEPGPQLQTMNHSIVRQCGLFVACLPKGVPTIGTIQEMVYAAELGRPVALFTDITNSWALANITYAIPPAQFGRFGLGVDAAEWSAFDEWVARVTRAGGPRVEFYSYPGGGAGGGGVGGRFELPPQRPRIDQAIDDYEEQ